MSRVTQVEYKVRVLWYEYIFYYFLKICKREKQNVLFLEITQIE